MGASSTRRRRRPPLEIKHPGALNRDVGGPSHEHIRKVEWLAKHGTPEQRHRAQLYLDVLRPANQRRREHRR